MFKRIFSLTLALLICCTASITVFSQAEHSHAEENDVSDVNEAAQGINASSTSFESATGDVKIDSEYIMTGTANSEYWEWLNGAPDEVLSGSTAEVLEYFLNSNFLGQQVLSCSSTPRKTEIDFSCHEAFREFISREDCIEVLESYAGSLLSSLEDDEFEITKLEEVLSALSMKPLLSDLESYPELQSMYTEVERTKESSIPYTTIATWDSEIRSDYDEWLCGAPDEILSASTDEVLEYFMNSNLLMEQVFAEFFWSSPRTEKVDYLPLSDAYRELCSRDDFIEALEKYTERSLDNLWNDEIDKAKIEKILAQPSVQSLISDSEYFADSYPNLQSIYAESEAATASVGDYVGTVNYIDYYSAGTISSANGCSVEVCTPERELSPEEYTSFNNAGAYYSGNIRLSEPTAVYNCHSYAWYRFSVNNPYWIMEIDEFLNDSGCTQLTLINTYTSDSGFTQLGSSGTVQANDIIVYYDANGKPLHSGVVYSVSSSGELTICSKWGQGGVYIHTPLNVSLGYRLNSSTISCAFFRYHDYENEYTGNEYHSGGRHYFEYADVCKICNKQINTTWTSVICSGPPCAIITAEQKVS